MTGKKLDYKIIKPDPLLFDFVESFWMLTNDSKGGKEIVVLPDGRIDLFFSWSANEPFHIMLMPLDSEPSYTTIEPRTVIFAVSFKLLSIEYLLEAALGYQQGKIVPLPENLWNISMNDLHDFDHFVKKVSGKIISILTSKSIDDRKRILFEQIYTSNGSLSVKELSEKAFWSNRQINRYFTQHVGISLKSYCNILRFKASFKHISEGRLFPEQNFTDQNHFIKEVKKFSGVVPKELSKNEGDRFVHILVLQKPGF